MGYCIGFILLLWLMSKAKPRVKDEPRYIDTMEDEVIYVTSDELDELMCRVDELEERLREVEG